MIGKERGLLRPKYGPGTILQYLALNIKRNSFRANNTIYPLFMFLNL